MFSKIRRLLARIFLRSRKATTPPTPRERFDRWFTAPVEVLERKLGNGDGAFVVMSIGFFLCERYFRSLGGQPDSHLDKTFMNLAATHFNVHPDFFDDFWNIYRNGMQHQGSPKRQVLTKHLPDKTVKPGYPISYRWQIDGSFGAVPKKWVNGGHTYICINPFEFTQRMIALWHADEARMAELTNHRLGEIMDLPPVVATTVAATDPYP